MNNTAIFTENGMTHVVLHSTKIVSFNANEIVLNNGGFITSTTARRMNEMSEQFDLKFKVFRKDGKMHVKYANEDIEFTGDVVTLVR